MERVGIERLRRLLVEDEEGIAAGLDAGIQAAVEAYVDPWQEADSPVHPAQFRDTLAEIPVGPPPDDHAGAAGGL